MKKIFIFSLFFLSVSFAQVEKNISVYRGDSTAIEFKVNGNITNKGIVFVVKLSKSFSSPRLIQKSNLIAGGSAAEITASFSAPQTKVTVYLGPEDTEDLEAATYYYDIIAADGSNLASYQTFNFGKFTFLNGGDVQTPFDGITPPTSGVRFYVAGTFIDSTVADSSLFMWDSTSQTMKTVSRDELADLLGVGDVDLSNVVDKTTAQTITGQKNFTTDARFGDNGEIRFDADSSKIEFRDSNFVLLKLDNSADNSPNFNLGTWNQADGNGGSTNRTLVFGYNVGPNGARVDLTKASFAWEIESNYLSGGEWAFEPHWTWFDNNGNQRKPFSLNLGKADGHTMGDFNFDKIRFKNPNNNADYITIYNDQIHGHGKNVIFHDSIPISLTINNFDYLTQANTSGTFVPMIRVDSDNKIRIDASSVGTVFGNSTYRYAYLSSSYQRFQGPLYLTDAGFNYSVHTDTALSLKITSAGYGIISSKYLYNVATEFHWSNASYSSKMIFQYGSGALTVGSVGTVGTGAIYAGSYYTGSTIGYLSSSPGSLTASGLYVAESSGGAATRQLYYRTITINGVTMQILTLDTP